MAESILSPGVYQRENDQSQITQQPVALGAAIIGPTVKGPVGIPTVVTSYSDYLNRFGDTFVSGGVNVSYFTSIAAYYYFLNGGESLTVARVVTGSYTSATAQPLTLSTSASFTLETIGEGVIFNNSGSIVNGALALGTKDNIRWEIVSRNTTKGTFDLTIRQGNDLTNKKSVLETWSNLSLDPVSPNYISSVIGDQKEVLSGSISQIVVTGDYPNISRYVRVSNVLLPTPNYLDNQGVAKSAFTGSIPLTGSGALGGAFSGATGDVRGGALFYDKIAAIPQGISPAGYDSMITLLSNADDYQFNMIVAPGLTSEHTAAQVNNLIINTQNRGDSIFVLDSVAYNSAQVTAINTARILNTSYAATYWPWLQVADPSTGKNVWVPASTMIPAVYTANDNSSAPWFAPAGLTRGALPGVVRPKAKLSKSDRDALYEGKVNPIATFPGQGIVVFGNKTLQTAATALDRVNVRRLLIELKSHIGQVSNGLVFEQNTTTTRNNFLSQINPYLESIQQRQGLYAYRVTMDETNNTSDVIDRNQLVGQIYIQPTRTAEFIVLDFNILPTGASFDS